MWTPATGYTHVLSNWYCVSITVIQSKQPSGELREPVITDVYVNKSEQTVTFKMEGNPGAVALVVDKDGSIAPEEGFPASSGLRKVAILAGEYRISDNCAVVRAVVE